MPSNTCLKTTTQSIKKCLKTPLADGAEVVSPMWFWRSVDLCRTSSSYPWAMNLLCLKFLLLSYTHIQTLGHTKAFVLWIWKLCNVCLSCSCLRGIFCFCSVRLCFCLPAANEIENMMPINPLRNLKTNSKEVSEKYITVINACHAFGRDRKNENPTGDIGGNQMAYLRPCF